jgi:hypothetical protein
VRPRLHVLPPPGEPPPEEPRRDTEEIAPRPLPWYGERGVQVLALGLCGMSLVLALQWCG